MCERPSARVHSRYERYLDDLPAHGRRVRIRLQVRRFRCHGEGCSRKIFAERFDEGVAQPWARRSTRLQEIVHYVALMLGGRPGQNLTQRLLLPVSNDTLLRAVRRRGAPRLVPPTVVGIDDWAWRRNQRYGTIVCDLEGRKTIALLPDREPATTEAWLLGQQQIEIIARDRGGGYGLAVARALPQAIQVADRWHLMEMPAVPSLMLCANPCAPPRYILGSTHPTSPTSGTGASNLSQSQSSTPKHSSLRQQEPRCKPRARPDPAGRRAGSSRLPSSLVARPD